MKYGEVPDDADVDFTCDAPLDPHAYMHDEAAARPGATFDSVYGRDIYSTARKTLSAAAARFGWSDRDRDAYWPSALTYALSIHAAYAADSGRDLPGTPSDSEIGAAGKRSAHFLNAWRIMTGNDMAGGRLSAHTRLDLAASVPEKFRNQAREIRETGVCQFTERCLEIGVRMHSGERDRADAERGRVRAASGKQRQRQRVR